MGTLSTLLFLPVSFPERLAALHRERVFTQQQMADKIGMPNSQLKRYESGAYQPTIDVFRRIAAALNVSADMLHMHGANRWQQQSTARAASTWASAATADAAPAIKPRSAPAKVVKPAKRGALAAAQR